MNAAEVIPHHEHGNSGFQIVSFLLKPLVSRVKPGVAFLTVKLDRSTWLVNMRSKSRFSLIGIGTISVTLPRPYQSRTGIIRLAVCVQQSSKVTSTRDWLRSTATDSAVRSLSGRDFKWAMFYTRSAVLKRVRRQKPELKAYSASSLVISHRLWTLHKNGAE